MQKFLFPHLLESGFTERLSETERIVGFIILIADLCVFLSTHTSYQYSNLQRYGNFTVVCKYRPELNFDNLNKFVNCYHQSISFAQWEIFMKVSSSSHNLGRELPYFCHQVPWLTLIRGLCWDEHPWCLFKGIGYHI